MTISQPMKYVRYEAPPELRLRYHFRNRFGRDITDARDYDPVTGIGHRLRHHFASEDDLVEFFEAQGFVEIDGHVNPSRETLDLLFATGKAVISNKEILDAVIKSTEQDARFKEGQQRENA